MRKKIVFFFILCIPFVISAQDNKSFPEDYKPTAWVNDYADMFSVHEESYLNMKLGKYEDTTSTQILIVTLPKSMHEDMPIELMGATIGEDWNIGQKGSDNGMIMVIYPEEQEISIQTGYGLEQYIPDAIAKRIIENEIKPSFRNEEYLKGMDDALYVIFGLLSGKFTADEYRQSSGNSAAPFGFLIILVLFFIFFGQSRRRRAHGIGRNVPFWIALGMLSGSRHSHGGSFGSFSSGSGSFGGFGGFGGGGGGSFGGGGASGGW